MKDMIIAVITGLLIYDLGTCLLGFLVALINRNKGE